MQTVFRRARWVLVLLLFCAPPVFAGDSELMRIERLASAGASELALQLLDQEQIHLKDPAAWARWEQVRIELLAQAERWQELQQRVQDLPGNVPANFLRWARGQQVRANLALGQGEHAIGILRRLIWSAGNETDELPEWRRQLVRAYLDADRPADAATAVLRYEQDYGPTDPDWRRLRARVLLANDRPQEARALLGDDRAPEAQALYLLAAMRSGALTPQETAQRAATQAQRAGIARTVRAELWVVAARAQAALGAYEEQLQALANAIGAGGSTGLLAADGSTLWETFRQYGRVLGNQRQLLTGNDDDWLRAGQAVAPRHPLRASALYAVLTATGSPSGKRTAHARLALLLEAQPQGTALLRAMYIKRNADADLSDLPAPVCLRLADVALANSDFPLASRLMGNLSEPPVGAEQWFWQLRRARILILGGDYEGGADALSQLLDRNRELSRDQLDRLMQVLFDLQRVGAHARALELFAKLPLPEESLKLRREVLYWRADSHKALGEYAKAAQLYLESAWLPGAEKTDQWSQTAQYQAADALAQAGLTNDARRIYQRLLALTTDSGRRAVLNSRLQQLSLTEGQQGHGETVRTP